MGALCIFEAAAAALRRVLDHVKVNWARAAVGRNSRSPTTYVQHILTERGRLACDCRCVAEGPQSDPSGMQQTLPGPVRGGAAMSRHRGHPGRHVRQQHGRPARVHVQGRGARLSGQPLLLSQGCRVPAGNFKLACRRETIILRLKLS